MPSCSCTSKAAKRRGSAYYFPSKRLLRALVCSRFLFLRNGCSGSATRVFFFWFCKETEAQQLHPRAHTHALITTVTDLADASSADKRRRDSHLALAVGAPIVLTQGAGVGSFARLGPPCVHGAHQWRQAQEEAAGAWARPRSSWCVASQQKKTILRNNKKTPLK